MSFSFLVGEDVQGGNLSLEKFVINKVFHFFITQEDLAIDNKLLK